ncbi:signal peptidase I [Pseudoalteromonas fenneropenaei]|uniref:Signal peptidase I n=1 Tax=Pseudoalteromonas fenneropenaei TaxID=1737459 RepID=A0ABV7CLU4_9GAMM
MSAQPFSTRTMQFLKENRNFILFIGLMSVFRSAFADWYTVPSGSMQPTIEIGDRITVNKMAYDLRVPFTNHSLLRTGEPARGDIMVFDSSAADERLIKRVVGLPGDTIAMRDEVVILNGKPLTYQLDSESAAVLIAREQLGTLNHAIQLDTTRPAALANFAAVTIPADHYLVLGDNRRSSADSRVYGLVPRNELLGKATYVAFSLDWDNHYLPRQDRVIKDLYN